MVVDRITGGPAWHAVPGAQEAAIGEAGSRCYELVPDPDEPEPEEPEPEEPDEPEPLEPEDPPEALSDDVEELDSPELLFEDEELALPLSVPDFLA
jgi:hypothetical protein